MAPFCRLMCGRELRRLQKAPPRPLDTHSVANSVASLASAAETVRPCCSL